MNLVSTQRSIRGAAAPVAFACCLLAAIAGAVHAEPAPVSAEARAVFDQAKDTLFQLRVIHKATRARNSSGTGFIATADGLVLTNYHVVARLALEPEAFELEIERTDGAGLTARLAGGLPPAAFFRDAGRLQAELEVLKRQ